MDQVELGRYEGGCGILFLNERVGRWGIGKEDGLE